MAERSSFYYVSSEYDKKEAIVLTQSTENVPAIFLNPSTNSFPLGVTLSRIMRLLPNILGYFEKFPNEFSILMEQRFVNTIGEYSSENLLTNMLINCLLSIPSDESLRKLEIDKIKSMVEFIETCSCEPKLLNTDNLGVMLFRITESLNTGKKVILGNDFENNSVLLNSEQIKSFLNNESTKTICYYKVDKVIDLFSASLQEIIKSKSAIKRCKFCNGYFVTDKRTDTLYCNLPTVNDNKTCAQKADLARRKENYHKESAQKIYHNIIVLWNSRMTYLEGEEWNRAWAEKNKFISEYYERKEYIKPYHDYSWKEMNAWLRKQHKQLLKVDKTKA